MRNDSLILSTGTMDGKIFIKTLPEGRPTDLYFFSFSDVNIVISAPNIYDCLELQAITVSQDSLAARYKTKTN